MKQSTFTITRQSSIADGVYLMELAGDTAAITTPGQFVNITVPGFYLRRPLSVCDWTEDSLTLIYKVFGNGTDALSRLEPGVGLDVLSGLGNGFDTGKSGSTPLVLGGGVGTPPLYALVKRLLREGKRPYVALGFQSQSDIFFEEAFRALGVPVVIATMDGSAGQRGTVLDAVISGAEYGYFYACGPMRMLKGVCETLPIPGQVSLEERMGCGFGACMGCSINTKGGAKRVCKEGPVFEKEEMIW